MSLGRLQLSLTLLLSAVAGCTHDPAPPLPTYPLMDAQQTLALMQDRYGSIQTLTGKGEIQLSSPQRGDVALESVFVLRPPGDARVRAWKFNQAVFDLTVTADGVWLYAPREQNGHGELSASTKSLGDSVRQWTSLLLGNLQTPDTTTTIVGDTLILTRPAAGGGRLQITIDRPTLTVRCQRLLDANNVERFRLSFDDYRSFGPTLWPAKVVAVSPTGTITVLTRSLTINDAPDTAFTPSPRATKLP